MADKACDASRLLDWCRDHGIKPVIAPGRNRKDQRDYDQHLYKLRHLVEDAFLKLEQWRSVATRHARTTLFLVSTYETNQADFLTESFGSSSPNGSER